MSRVDIIAMAPEALLTDPSIAAQDVESKTKMQDIYNQYHTLIGAVSHYEVVGEETEGRIEMIANELKRAVEQTRMAMGWQ